MSCLLLLVGRVGEGQLLSFETGIGSSERGEGRWSFPAQIGTIQPKEPLRPLFDASKFRNSCSLGERGTMKVVGRVRRGVIVYRRPPW